MAPRAEPVPTQVRLLTEVITLLRRALRTSIRTDYPWESLPMAQVELLQCLRDREPVRIGEVAVALRLAPNTVSGLAQQLVDAGLVARVTDATDRRAALLALTGAGHQRLAQWIRAHEQRIGEALAGLTAPDRAAVLAALPALAQLVDHLTGIPVDAPGSPSGADSGDGADPPA